MRTQTALVWIALLVLASTLSIAAPLGTAFTYQGLLNDGGAPASGVYDFEFTVHGAGVDGSQIGQPVAAGGVGVNNGLFTVPLDFGLGVLNGDERWLQIAVRTNDGGAFIKLTPRQPLRPTPYALHAESAGGVANNQVVQSVNGLRDDILILAGTNIVVQAEGNNLRLSATVTPVRPVRPVRRSDRSDRSDRLSGPDRVARS
jgi:hypothetical protein